MHTLTIARASANLIPRHTVRRPGALMGALLLAMLASACGGGTAPDASEQQTRLFAQVVAQSPPQETATPPQSRPAAPPEEPAHATATEQVQAGEAETTAAEVGATVSAAVGTTVGADTQATGQASAQAPVAFALEADARAPALSAAQAAAQAQALAGVPVIYTVGDSTVETNSAGSYPRAGWGQVLGHFLDKTKVAVVNKAVGGSSARTFYNNYWNGVKTLLKPGDYVTIGFGINDASSNPAWYSDPFTTFQDILASFVAETRARGAYPILVATQPRNAWSAGTPPAVAPVYHDYPVASRQLAAELGVPLVDLDQRATALMQAVGQPYSTNFLFNYYLPGEWPNYPNGHADALHFQETGSLELARMVIAEIRRQYANQAMARLIPFIKPTYRVSFSTNNSAAGLISRSEYFPAGATVTAYARPYAGYAFVSWNGDLNASKRNLTFTMGTTPRTLVATFSGSPALYQAEAAQLSGSGTAVQTAAAGYRGSGYVDFPANGGALTFTNANGGDGGSRVLRIRYALGGSAARSGSLVVNGVATTIRFNPSGSPSTWATMDVAVTLRSGATNAIAFRSTGGDLANIDELTVR